MNLIAIAGPTAVGKSEIALLLAEKIRGEIISVDSMQVYRGLDIGTAKPSAEQRRRVRHHLTDVADLNESFDAARFVRLATEAIADIQRRGATAILCGGTGFYFQALFEGLGDAPAADPKLRRELEITPLPVLLQELAERDPVTFESIDRKNPRRVVRAVEVIRLTGRPFSEQRARWGFKGARAKTAELLVLTRKQEDLHARISSRVDEMFRRGVVAETAQLLGRGLAKNQTACQAIGYRQVIEHLEGRRDLRETIELVKTKTRQFARRQLTWFRKYGSARFIELESEATPASSMAQLEEYVEHIQP